jgi:hypothetical protein
MLTPRRSLADILPRVDRENLASAWEATRPADDLEPLPAGTYDCLVGGGALFTSRNDTPGYRITFEVLDGEHAGRTIWHEVWLTQAALAMAKRDLGKLGVTRLEQLERPLPAGIRAAVSLAVRRDDGGAERNRVVRFDVTGNEPVGPDPFAPADDDGTAGPDSLELDDGGFNWATGRQQAPPARRPGPGAYGRP